MNDAMSFSELRKNLKAACDKVCSEHEPLLIKRRNGEDVVILSRADYESLDETARIELNPYQSAHLKASMAEVARGEMVTFKNTEALEREVNKFFQTRAE